MKVRIHASIRTRYVQTVEMTKEEWDEIKATPHREMDNFDLSPALAWLNLNEVYDADDLDDVELLVLDGDAIADRYGD